MSKATKTCLAAGFVTVFATGCVEENTPAEKVENPGPSGNPTLMNTPNTSETASPDAVPIPAGLVSDPFFDGLLAGSYMEISNAELELIAGPTFESVSITVLAVVGEKLPSAVVQMDDTLELSYYASNYILVMTNADEVDRKMVFTLTGAVELIFRVIFRKENPTTGKFDENYYYVRVGSDGNLYACSEITGQCGNWPGIVIPPEVTVMMVSVSPERQNISGVLEISLDAEESEEY